MILEFIPFTIDDMDMWVNFDKMVVFSNTDVYKLCIRECYWDNDFSGSRIYLSVSGGIIYRTDDVRDKIEKAVISLYETWVIEKTLLKENEEVWNLRLNTEESI